MILQPGVLWQGTAGCSAPEDGCGSAAYAEGPLFLQAAGPGMSAAVEQTRVRSCAKLIGRHVLHLAFFCCAVSLICTPRQTLSPPHTRVTRPRES